MKRTVLIAATWLLGGASLAVSTDAWAKPTPAPPASQSDVRRSDVRRRPDVRRSDVEVVRVDGRKIIRFHKGWVIPGAVQRPLAVYFLERSSVRYGWQPLEKDFTPRIVDATRSGPF